MKKQSGKYKHEQANLPNWKTNGKNVMGRVEESGTMTLALFSQMEAIMVGSVSLMGMNNIKDESLSTAGGCWACFAFWAIVGLVGLNLWSPKRRRKKKATQIFEQGREGKKEEKAKELLERMEGGGEEGVEKVVDSKDLQQQSKALDKLTDRVEDRQLDSTRVQEAMASIAASAQSDLNAMRIREKELAAVKINAADVDIIANELELDRKIAERTLREHKGDAVAAIRHLLH
ncbi:hypothetical protein VNO77_23738 [Canavalia gladiata]|uniref:Nascent polypeptide-associated complex subunit alpha-like UBA domain-containing protein n=1 Tax=Canavalia gladiata TaxID=3824 RepID=A0AAN9QFL1_CANGL